MKVLHILGLLVICCLCGLACIIQQSDNQGGIWERKNYPRKTSKSCECGKTKFDNFTVLIRVKNSYNGISLCSGTIIASNLIVTSHKCLTWKSRNLNIFAVWNPRHAPREVIKLDQVVVTYGKKENIWIDKIIFHPRYIESVNQNKFPEFDFALLRIRAGDPIIKKITGTAAEGNAKSVCIPTVEEASNLLYVKASYYGFRLDHALSFSIIPRHVQHRRIFPGSECDRLINTNLLSGLDSVCLKFDTYGPENEGGSLVTTDKSKTAYLTGIASWVGHTDAFTPNELKFAYFSHIKYAVRYLEYQASIQKSTFCRKQAAKFEAPSLPSNDEVEEELWRYQENDHKETLDCACGHSNIGRGSPRIMRGEEAKPYEFGWMAQVIAIFPTHDMACGGSIINDKMILTAAHCVVNPETYATPPPDKFLIFIGAHAFIGDPNSVQLNVSAVVVHPGYLEAEKHLKEIEFDIALIILKNPLSFPSLGSQKENSKVPICLPKIGTRIDVVGKIATVAGWGLNDTDTTKEIGKQRVFFDNLHKLSQPILPLDECKEHMPPGSNYVSDNYICGAVGLEKDAAEGDSGGPLFIPERINGRSDEDKNYHWIQVGIVSFAQATFNSTEKPKGILDNAAIYTNLQNFLSFVNYFANKHGARWCKFEGTEPSAYLHQLLPNYASKTLEIFHNYFNLNFVAQIWEYLDDDQHHYESEEASWGYYIHLAVEQAQDPFFLATSNKDRLADFGKWC